MVRVAHNAPMNIRRQFLLSGVIAALTLPLSVRAADPPRCNELFDDAQRLGCYDAVFGKPVRPVANSTTPVAPVAPAVAPATAVAPAAAATAAAAGTAATTAGANVPVAPAPTSIPKAAKSTAYKSTVSALGQSGDGRFVATLDNGEQWLQLEKNSRQEIKVGDAVTLKPMALGSWTIVTQSGYSQRVKRVK